MIEKISKMSGAAFDKAYMQDMVKDHQKDVAEFQKESSNGSDPDLKSWAATTLPTLQEHLRMAKEALSAVNGSAINHKQPVSFKQLIRSRVGRMGAWKNMRLLFMRSLVFGLQDCL